MAQQRQQQQQRIRRAGQPAQEPLLRREGDLVRNCHHRGIVIGAFQLTGITRLLREECYPQYDYALATHGYFDEDEAHSTQPVGQEVGRLVDRQITSLVRMMWTYGLDWAHIPGASRPPHPPPPAYMTDSDLRLLRRLQQTLDSERGRAHPFTREFFRQLRKNRLLPVQSQVAVGSEQHRIGTMVDVVATPSSHAVRSRNHNSFALRAGAEVFILEVKCGFQRSYRRHTGQFMAYPHRWTDTPQSQHQLQLAVTCDLFRRTFQTPIAGAYILRLFEVRRTLALALLTRARVIM
jgi:hypothetical protein